jgi:two-component system chemotaxis sensor kinase CheA
VSPSELPGGDEPFSDFLNDYFAECDEHLMGVRRLLLTLEQSIGHGDVNTSVLDELFRHFHSLKGISGMVELRPAEELSHRTEDYLRALRRHDVRLSPEGVNVLFDATQLLEQVVNARRSGGASPAIDAAVPASSARGPQPPRKPPRRRPARRPAHRSHRTGASCSRRRASSSSAASAST